MKQVVNGKSYNTETALPIGVDKSNYNAGDFRFEHTTMYRTKKGAFFLAGKGGPMSRWGRSYGNGTVGGSGIQPLSTQEALEWCECNDISVDVIEQFFDVEEA